MRDKISRHPVYRKILQFIGTEHLLDGIRRIEIALSGGADSVCLLAVLGTMKRGIELRAHHVRHHLRDDAQDADIARQNAALFGIEYLQTDLDWPQGIPQANIEEIARNARYEALFSKILPGSALAIAHHGDENLETALWRLGRGCGIEGIALAPKRIEHGIVLIRPLLAVSKEDVYSFLRDNQLHWAEDPTNASAHYRRNRIRHDLLPAIKQEAMSNDCLYRSLVDIRHDADAISSFAESFVQSCPAHLGGWFCVWNRWHSLSREAQFQVIRHAARMLLPGHCPSRDFIVQAVELLEMRPQTRRQIENGRIHVGFSHQGVMMWSNETLDIPQNLTVPIPCSDLPVLKIATLTVWRSIPQDALKNTTSLLHIRADAIEGELTICPACQFHDVQASNGNLAKLSEALRSQGVPDVWRKHWPVLCDARGPLWVLGGMRTLNAVPAKVGTPAVTFDVRWL